MRVIRNKFLAGLLGSLLILLMLPPLQVFAADIRYEQTHSSVVFSAGWSTWEHPTLPSGGSIKFSDIAGSTATFSFIGTSVSWIDAPQANRGVAKVYIDNLYQQDVDLYSATGEWHEKVVYSKTGLSDGAHTIKIEVTGTKNASASGAYVGVDAFVTNGSANPPSAPTGVSVSAPVSGGSLVLSWTNEPNLAYVEIMRGQENSGETKILPERFTGSSATDSSLAGGIKYSYKLRTVTSQGITSNWSTPTYGVPYSPVPSGVTVENEGTGGKLIVKWTNPAPGTYTAIRIYRSTVSGALGIALGDFEGNSYVDSGLTNGSTYYYVVRTVGFSDEESVNSEQFSGSPSLTKTRYEEGSPEITYTGEWSELVNSEHSGGAAKASNKTGSTTTFAFTGTSVSWIATKAANRGIARVLIDGRLEGNVDLFSLNIVYRSKVFIRTGLADSSHEIRIDVTGTKNPSSADTYVDIDAFDLDPAPSPGASVTPIPTPTPTAVAGATVGSGEIVGRVVNRAGQTIPGTAVRVNATVVPTNPGGEFRFTLVGAGVYTVYYDAPGHRGQTQVIEVKAGQSTRCPTVILDPGITPSTQGEIYGRVVNPAHQPLGGAAVRINGVVMPTNAAGEFRFQLVNPGVYTVYYDAAGYSGQTQLLEVKAGMVTYPPMVILSGTLGEIYGRILDAATRRPIPGTAVRVNSSVMPTNPGGEFRFTLVHPGIYKVYYDAPGYKGQVQENIAVFAGTTTICPTVLMSR